jgi:hypothetical protein
MLTLGVYAKDQRDGFYGEMGMISPKTTDTLRLIEDGLHEKCDRRP